MITYERVKPGTAVPVADNYLELKMLCSFYFVLESKKVVIMSVLQSYPRNASIFLLFIIFFYLFFQF